MSYLRAWSRWQRAAGPWRGWAICPALTMPGGVLSSDVRTTKRCLPEVEPTLESGGTALVLDLEPALGVLIAAEISRRQLAHVVLVLPRWPHEHAVLPVGDLLATLVASSRHLREPTLASNVVFVLDAERQQSIRRPATDARVDNRYSLSVGDLPNLATLRQAGIQRILKVAHQP